MTTTMNAVGCSYAEKNLVNLNNKDKFVKTHMLIYDPYYSLINFCVRHVIEYVTTRGRQAHTVQALTSVLLHSQCSPPSGKCYSK